MLKFWNGSCQWLMFSFLKNTLIYFLVCAVHTPWCRCPTCGRWCSLDYVYPRNQIQFVRLGEKPLRQLNGPSFALGRISFLQGYRLCLCSTGWPCTLSRLSSLLKEKQREGRYSGQGNSKEGLGGEGSNYFVDMKEILKVKNTVF